MAETPYTETEVLLAIMNSDVERADELLSDFSLNELATFDRQLQMARDFVARWQRSR